ncbi:substrate-binding domain-containing protein [Streptomyces sp. NPDC000927]|uniref:substrate-binding domain-containing protein n=1 Tax=unclassified Streptomyces TaxID=2593676 RepID=UPI00332684A4
MTNCPGDTSVIGFNDLPFIDKLCPPLTSVHIPRHKSRPSDEPARQNRPDGGLS